MLRVLTLRGEGKTWGVHIDQPSALTSGWEDAGDKLLFINYKK